MEQITEKKKFPNLAFLSIDDVRILDDGVRVETSLGKDTLCLGNSNMPPKLRYMCLRDAGLDAGAIRALAGGLDDAPLQHLILAGNPGIEAGMSDLVDALSLSTTITHLDLSNNALRAAGTRFLSDAVMECDQMIHVNISRCRLGADGAEAFSRTVLATHKNLVTLDLSRNAVGLRGAKHISDALRVNSVLRRLDVSHNELGPQGGSELALGLAENTGLRELVLDGNELTDEGCFRIGGALREQQSLNMLSCVDDSFDVVSALSLALYLRGCPLSHLYLGDTVLSIVGTDMFNEFTEAPLTFTIRNKWKRAATALAWVLNLTASAGLNEDEFEPSSQQQNVIIPAKDRLKVRDKDAASALRLLLGANRTLYSESEQLELLGTLLGDVDEAGEGLRRRELLHVRWTVPSSGAVVASSRAELVEDLWSCGAHLAPIFTDQPLDSPVDGWARAGCPDFGRPEIGRVVSNVHADKWLVLKRTSIRYAEHGFWAIYWSPEHKRSFCMDRREHTEEVFFWLPERSDPTSRKAMSDTERHEQLKKDLENVRSFGKKGWLHLYEEASSWIAEVLGLNRAIMNDIGLARTIKREEAKLKRLFEGWKGIEGCTVTFPDPPKLLPSAADTVEAICFTLCAAFSAGEHFPPLRRFHLPWMQRAPLTRGEKSTALLTALSEGNFAAADYLINRRSPISLELEMDLVEVDSAGKVVRSFDTFETKEHLEGIDLTSSQVSYMEPLKKKSVVISRVPDLLKVSAGIESMNEDEMTVRGESSLFLAARAGQVAITKKLLELGASFNDNHPTFETLRDLLFDMCCTKVSDELGIEHVLKVTGLIDDMKSRPLIPLELHPLYGAIDSGSIEIAEAVLNSNGPLVQSAINHEGNIVDAMGTDTVVGYALQLMQESHEEEEDSLRLTVAGGHRASSSIAWRTADGWTLLSRAIYLGQLVLADLLMEFRAVPIYTPKQEEELLDEVAASVWVDSSDWNDETGVEMKVQSKSLKRLASSRTSFADGPESNSEEITLWAKPTSVSLVDKVEVKRGKVPVPNAYSVALIREYHQGQLMNHLESLDDGSKDFDIRIKNARGKLELATAMVGQLNQHKDVGQLRRMWISSFAMGKALFHFAFIIVFVVAALESSRSTPSKYIFNSVVGSKTIGNALPLDTEIHNIAFFNDVGSEDDLWTFLDSTLMDNLYPSGFEDGWLDDHNRLLGAVKLHQDRAPSVCKESVRSVWSELAPVTSSSATKSCYRLADDSSIDYNILLSHNGTEAAAAIAALQDVEWIDGATTVVTVEYVVGNIRDELIQLARLEVEFHSTGGASAKSTFIVLPSSSVGSWSRGDALAVVVGIIFLTYSVEEVYEYMHLGFWNYFTDGWNLGDLFTCALGLTWCALLLKSRTDGIKILKDYTNAGGEPDDHVLDLWQVGDGYLSAEAVVGFALMAVCFKLIKYLRFLPMLGPNMLSLLHTLLSIRVFTFGVFVAFFVTSVGVGAYVRFGASAEEFSDMGVSVFSIFTAVLGESFQEVMLGGETDFTSGMAFFLFLSFVGTAILGNVFISVTGSVYDEAYQNSERNWEAAVDALMMRNNWVKARGELGISNFARWGKFFGRGFFKKACRAPNWNAVRQAKNDFKQLQQLEKDLKLLDASDFDMLGDESSNKRKSLLSWKSKKKRKSISGVDVVGSFWEAQEFRRKKLSDRERILGKISEIRQKLQSLELIDIDQSSFSKALWGHEGDRHISKTLLLHNLSDEAVKKWKEMNGKRKDEEGE